MLTNIVCYATVLREDLSTICYTSLKICQGENLAKALIPIKAEFQVCYALLGTASVFDLIS